MSSNLILNDGVIEKTTNKKTCKRKGALQKMSLKSDRKKPNKNKIWKKISSQKIWENDQDKIWHRGMKLKKTINKKTMQKKRN